MGAQQTCHFPRTSPFLCSNLLDIILAKRNLSLKNQTLFRFQSTYPFSIFSPQKTAQFWSLIFFINRHRHRHLSLVSLQRPFSGSQKDEQAREATKGMMFDFRGSNSLTFSAQKPKHVFVKFAVFLLFFGLALRLLFSGPVQFSPVAESAIEAIPTVEEALPPAFNEPSVSDYSPANLTRSHQNVAEECDIFTGFWIPDPSGPVYTNESCPFIEDHQNCRKNGRPDSQYLYWRWKPRDCDLPMFDPLRFLDLMRNKSWAFVGDSISRNQVQSLLCSLSQVEQAVEVYHDKEYRSKRWHFPLHNFTLSVVWTPFLLKAAIFEDSNGISSADIQLHLDKLDELWTNQYRNFDYMVIAGGKWFLKTTIYYENSTIKGCHNCLGKNLTELGFDHAYQKALQLIFKFVASSHHKAHVIFRTTTPDHFENGEWFSGGYCNRTAPFKGGEVDLSSVDAIMHDIELEEYEKAMVAVGSEKGITLKLLDTTHLLLLRPDGHPGAYRQFHPFAVDKSAKVQNDCLHWCLPGPMDSINDLLMKMIEK